MLARALLLDEVSGLGIEGPDFARRLAQWHLRHLRAQKIEPRGDALGLLQGKAIEVATAHKLLNSRGAFGLEPQCLEGPATNYEPRLVGLTQLELNAFGKKL